MGNGAGGHTTKRNDMKYYIRAIKNYAVFKGRTTRKEFWMFALFNIIVAIALGVIVSIISIMANMTAVDSDCFIGTVSNLYVLFMLLPTVSILVRRLHDIGRSGWYCLLAFIPLVGIICMIIIGLIDTEPFPNEYGISSKFGPESLIYAALEEAEEVEAEIIE